MFPLINRRNIKVFFALLLLLLLLFSIASWRFLNNSVPVQSTIMVTRQTLEQTVLASGILQPIMRVDVGSQASGQLTSLKVNPGDFVTQGQLLGEIDPALSQNSLRDAEVALNSLLAQKKANEAQLTRSLLMLKRQQQMFTQHASAQQDVESAQAEWQVQKAQLASMNAQIHQQQIRVETAKTNLGYTQIIAPVSGTVLSVSTQAGQTVVASYQIPVILQIADLNTMTVKAQIPEADFARISPGQPVCFTTLGAADKRYCSTINTVEPAPEKVNNAVFFNALFDVDNPKGDLRPDMTAQVSIVLNRAVEVLAVPITALGRALSTNQYQILVVNAAGKNETRTVLTGIDDGIHIEITRGLQDGESVVLPNVLATGEA